MVTESVRRDDLVNSLVRGIDGLLKTHGFTNSGKRQWRRLHGDAVQVILLDHRRVGRYPYEVEMIIDFQSMGAAELERVNMYGARLILSRVVADRDGFLSALDPASDFGSMDERLYRIRTELEVTAFPLVDLVDGVASLKRLKSRYPSDNDLNLTKRMRDRLEGVSVAEN